jgi:AcrR family transcriptional regulator
MPRPKQTSEQVAEMRERILQAAVDILRREGFEAVSIRAIAERLGVSHMTLYTYFRNREELMATLDERQRERMQVHRAETLREAREGDVRAVVREWLGIGRHVAAQHPQIYRFLWVQPIEAERAAHQHQKIQANLNHLAELIRLGQKRGVFVERDPLLAAGVVFGSVNAPLIMYHGGRLPDAELCDRLIDESISMAMEYLCGRNLDNQKEPL